MTYYVSGGTLNLTKPKPVTRFMNMPLVDRLLRDWHEFLNAGIKYTTEIWQLKENAPLYITDIINNDARIVFAHAKVNSLIFKRISSLTRVQTWKT